MQVETAVHANIHPYSQAGMQAIIHINMQAGSNKDQQAKRHASIKVGKLAVIQGGNNAGKQAGSHPCRQPHRKTYIHIGRQTNSVQAGEKTYRQADRQSYR